MLDAHLKAIHLGAAEPTSPPGYSPPPAPPHCTAATKLGSQPPAASYPPSFLQMWPGHPWGRKQLSQLVVLVTERPGGSRMFCISSRTASPHLRAELDQLLTSPRPVQLSWGNGLRAKPRNASFSVGHAEAFPEPLENALWPHPRPQRISCIFFGL